MPNQFNVPLEHDRSNIIGALLADAGYATGFTGKFHVGPLWTQEQLLEYSSANHSDRLGMSNLFCRNELTAREIIRRTYGFTWAKRMSTTRMCVSHSQSTTRTGPSLRHTNFLRHISSRRFIYTCALP